MYDTILVPVDGSDHAERAADHAAALARGFDAVVHVLSVVDVQAAAGLFSAGGVDDEFVGRLESEAEDAIAAAVDRLDTDDVETATVEGRPGEEIVDYSEAAGVDAIVMGTHGRTGLRRFVAGSVSEQVVRLADVPVVTVRATGDRDPPTYDRVLVPTDGSNCAGTAVDHALAVAEAHDATLCVLNVIDVGAIASQSNVTPATAVLEEFREAGAAAVGAVADRARERGVDVETEVIEGFPANDILDYAEDEAVDMIAMGTHGRTGVGRFLLGSVTERTIRHASVPVLSVKPVEDE